MAKGSGNAGKSGRARKAAGAKCQRKIQREDEEQPSSKGAKKKKPVQAGPAHEPEQQKPQHLHDAATTAEAVEKEGRHCFRLMGDVKDPAFCRELVEKTVATLGQLDVLVNNAAFQMHCDKLEDLTDEHLQETLQTNIAGYFHMARAALPHLKQGSAIVNTGSETGLFGSGALLDYSATKGAIHAFTRALAKNLLPRGIRVNAVAPGPVWTPLNPSDRPAEDVAKFGSDSAMGRAAQPEELAPAYVFLAAPVCSSYISGSVLEVLGGPTG